jgi:ABC-2 type transport system permease protein
MTTMQILPGAERQLKSRPSLRLTMHHSLTMAHRGLLKFRRLPEQFLDVTFIPILFTLLFTFAFGGAIAGDTKSYLPIIIPGILVMTVLTTSVTTGVQLREDMDKGVFDRFRTLPIARTAPLAGALLADSIRYAIATTVTFVMGFLLGYRPDAGLTGVSAGALLVIVFGWCVSWIWAFLGVTSRSAGSVQGASMLVLFPVIFLSNAFVPIDTMPSWLQTFANASPVTHLISAVRQLTDQGSIGRDFWLSLLGAVAIVAIFAPLTVRAYMRKT